MRYFTRGFVGGELDEDEQEQVRLAYGRRLEAIQPGLPAAVRELAGLSLHDGQIEDEALASALEVQRRCGTLPEVSGE
jgi:hypothetical protein